MEFLVSACSDVGIRKKVNEDSFCIKEAETAIGKVLLTVVCDGMGGLSKGELASATVIRAFSQWFEEELPRLLKEEFKAEYVTECWNKMIQQLNVNIGSYGAKCGAMLGTTVTAALMVQDQLIVGHVGDSRLYSINKDVEQITEDQTVVQRDVNSGRITIEQAKVDPRKNVLLQCVGASKVVVPEFKIQQLNKDTTYILCSDGFRHEITEDEIFLSFNPSRLKDEATIEKNAQKLVNLNKERREKDNITVVVVRTY